MSLASTPPIGLTFVLIHYLSAAPLKRGSKPKIRVLWSLRHSIDNVTPLVLFLWWRSVSKAREVC